jgi:hypothetical protein
MFARTRVLLSLLTQTIVVEVGEELVGQFKRKAMEGYG